MNPAKTFVTMCLAAIILFLLPGAAHAWTEVPAQAVPQQTPTPFDAPTANSAANLRAGPGTEYAKMGTVEAGQPIWVIGQNEQGDWLQLRTGVWIAASLVNNVAPGWPVASNTYATASPEETQYIIDMTRLYNALIATFIGYTQDPEGTGNDAVVTAINDLEEWRASTKAPPGLVDQAARFEVQTDICYPILNGPFAYNAVSICLLVFMLPDAIPNKFRDSSQVGGAPLLLESTATPARTATPTARPKTTQAPTATPAPRQVEYKGMLANIWAGVKVYYGNGTEKRYAFEILGGGECSFGHGAYVEYPDGTREWKSRMAMIDGPFFVRADDPAIKAWAWYEYDCDQ